MMGLANLQYECVLGNRKVKSVNCESRSALTVLSSYFTL
jgi:hypothetical protein